jgi:hypothetical protein
MRSAQLRHQQHSVSDTLHGAARTGGECAARICTQPGTDPVMCLQVVPQNVHRQLCELHCTSLCVCLQASSYQTPMSHLYTEVLLLEYHTMRR